MTELSNLCGLAQVRAVKKNRCAASCVFTKGVRKWTPLKLKGVPAGGSSFGPFIVANLLKRLFQAETDLTSNSRDWNLELGRSIFARMLFVAL